MASKTPTCGICDSRDICKPSIAWCFECNEGLCVECKDHHILNKASKSHGIIPVNEFQKLPVSVLQIAESCKFHSERYQAYCHKHECSCCTKCLIEDHKNCKNLTDMNDVLCSIKSSNMMLEIENSLREIAENLKRIRKNRVENLSSLTLYKQNIEREICKSRHEMNEHFDRFERELLNELQIIENNERKKISKMLTSVERKEKEIDELQTSLGIIKKHASDLQTFLVSKKIEHELIDTDSFIQSMQDNNELADVIISLQTDNSVKSLYRNILRIGEIVVTTSHGDLSIVRQKIRQAQTNVAAVTKCSPGHPYETIEPEVHEKEYHAAVKKYIKRDDWYMWANMNKGGITLPMFTSLDAYWPGILSMLGDNDQAMKTLHNFHQVWKQYGFTPEYYNIPKNEAHKGREGYPLRPELIESVMYLYRATKDPFLLDIGVDIIEAIEQSTKTKCGYATVKDVNNHLLENRMESFFLAETTKYLYLLFDPDNFIHNNGSSGTVIQTPNGECVIDAGGYFFTTEAHPIDSAAVYCCSAAKKEDDAILQGMHDNLDLLSLLDILDSTETIIGEKLILKQKKEEKSQKLKGETGTIDEFGKIVEENKNVMENKNIENEKIKDGKDESIDMKNENEKRENDKERDIKDENVPKKNNNMDVKKDNLHNKKESLDSVT